MEPNDVTHFSTPADFRAWLARHGSTRDELWVGYWKKGTGHSSVNWEETVDEALCFGWIDGIRKRIDDEAYTIRFTPRRTGSVWSLRNVERYSALAALGLIEPPGAAAWERRKEGKTGTYSFEQSKEPALSSAFLKRLKANAAAWSDWQARPPGYRRTAAHWVMSAKREDTRERRFTALIADSEAGRKVKPLR